MKKIIEYIKKETVLTVAWILALLSAFVIAPDRKYIDYIDFRSLGILWSLMVVMQGFKNNGVFEKTGSLLLKRTRKVWQLCSVLVFLCFFCSMFITNDVALITFVPFAVMMLKGSKREDLMVPVVVLQTLAANLGSMLTPIGNPQNLYLYGISGAGMGEFVSWMLPYTVASFVLLGTSVCMLKGKNENVTANIQATASISADARGQSGPLDNVPPSFKANTPQIVTYLGLFILAILVVVRIIPYWIVVLTTLAAVFIVDRKVLVSVDYALLATFVGFFIFTGNMGRVQVISEMLLSLVSGREIIVGVLVSQLISNVPAALLLSGFAGDIKALAIGVNIGGLGTLIASMASLISYKIFVNEYKDEKGKYFVHFTLMNIIYLVT